MKVQCDSCEKTAAVLMCCADEAALCSLCDARVHAANKLAGKHQRIPLLDPDPSDNIVSCDICQEKSAHFFCLEDRAILCRNCDVAIHSANALTSKHTRFLVTGIRVGLNACPTEEADMTTNNNKSLPLNSSDFKSPPLKSSDFKSPPRKPQAPMKATTNKPNFESPTCAFPVVPDISSSPIPTPTPTPTPTSISTPTSRHNSASLMQPYPPLQSGMNGPMESGMDFDELALQSDPQTENLVSNRSGVIPGWQVDDLLGLTGISTNYSYEDLDGPFRGSLFNYGGMEPSKGDSPTLGDMGWLSDMNCFNEQNSSSGESFGRVPQILSPPTPVSGMPRSSGLLGFSVAKGKGRIVEPFLEAGFDDTLVPDVGAQACPNLSMAYQPSLKRRRA